MLLINAVVDPDTVQDLDRRMTLRNQLYQGGLERVLNQMTEMNNELLNQKVKEFRQLEEQDNAMVYGASRSNVGDPAEILGSIVSATNGTRAFDSLRNILHQLSIIQQDLENR